MSPETVRAGIDLWRANVEDTHVTGQDYGVLFYGGEPLLNPSAITAGVDYIEQLQNTSPLPEGSISLSSNGHRDTA
jgi:sulfatase maturation enzyme AslB (radical SAM superfamily)